jgi:hypothetical protein
MTDDIFQDWILVLEQQMKAEKRKILLSIDNCLAQKNVPRHIEHLKIIFLPPNCTCILQSLDQGIVHAARVYYRLQLVQGMLVFLWLVT